MDEEEQNALDALQFADIAIESETNRISAVPREDLDLDILDGDLKITSGPAAIRASLIRRLRTPLGSIGVVYTSYTTDGKPTIVNRDTNYGSELGQYISEPMTNNWLRTMVQALGETASLEPNITVSSIDIDSFDPASGKIKFRINYSINGDDTQQSLGFSTSAQGIEFGL